MANQVLHIYFGKDEAQQVLKAADDLRTSYSALVRGAIKFLTKNYTDFSGAQEWLDYKSRGRPMLPSTGDEMTDIARNLHRHGVSAGTVEWFQSRVRELTESGLTTEDAIAQTISEGTTTPYAFDEPSEPEPAEEAEVEQGT
jgi:hypothetical protein